MLDRIDRTSMCIGISRNIILLSKINRNNKCASVPCIFFYPASFDNVLEAWLVKLCVRMGDIL